MRVLTRRQFLAGSVVAGAAAAGGGVALTSERVRHRLGLSNSPDQHVPSAHIPHTSGALQSRFMKRSVGWTLSVPTGALLGVVYCLHGRSNTHRFAFDTIHLDDFAAAANLRIAIASVDGGASSYWHRRTDGTDAQAMLMNEFIPMIERRVGTHPRALLGWSMGGYGALLAAERAPQQFAAVAAASPALWRSAGQTAPGAFDNAADYETHDVFANAEQLKAVLVRLDCGTNDPFYRADRAFASLLTGPHVTRYGPGYHDAAFWRSIAPAQLTTIGAALQSR